MTRKYFGTDGVRGKVGEASDHAGFRDASGLCRRQGAGGAGEELPQGEHPAVLIGKDTRISGYMLESALQAGLVRGRRGCAADRADADPGGGLSDPRAARPGRHRHQRLAQSVRG